MTNNNIEKKVENLLRDVIQREAYDLYDVEYLKEGKEYHLCIYIDKEDGIDISDCEKINEIINPILDEADYISEQYFLEVSSCGLEKKLRKREHFEKQIGNKLEIRLYQKIDNQKQIVGILKEYNNDYLILEVEEKEIEIKLNQITSAKTVFDW